jgi:hypothetical protein
LPTGWLFPNGFRRAPEAADRGGETCTLRHPVRVPSLPRHPQPACGAGVAGHASIATTERYTAVDDGDMRAAIMAAGYEPAPRLSTGFEPRRVGPDGFATRRPRHVLPCCLTRQL